MATPTTSFPVSWDQFHGDARYVTEVSQDTWISFPWDLGMSFQEPIVGPA